MNQPLSKTTESREFAEVGCDWTFVNAAVWLYQRVLFNYCVLPNEGSKKLGLDDSRTVLNHLKCGVWNWTYCQLLRHGSARFAMAHCSVLLRVYISCLVHNMFFGSKHIFSWYHWQANKTTMIFYQLVLSFVSYQCFSVGFGNWWASVANFITLPGRFTCFFRQHLGWSSPEKMNFYFGRSGD